MEHNKELCAQKQLWFTLRYRYGFTFKEVEEEFPEKKPAYPVAILADIVDKSMLYNISWNNYHYYFFERESGNL